MAKAKNKRATLARSIRCECPACGADIEIDREGNVQAWFKDGSKNVPPPPEEPTESPDFPPEGVPDDKPDSFGEKVSRFFSAEPDETGWL